jgi:23S rRNA (guanosine2251-2'-O)-methyltransferase
MSPERKAASIARKVNDYFDEAPVERTQTVRYGGHEESGPAAVDQEAVDEEFIYGRNAVVAFLIEGKVAVNKIYMASGLESDRRIDKIKELAKENSIVIATVEKRKLSDLIGDRDKHQGVVAQIAASEYLDISEFLDQFDAEKAALEAEGKSLDGYTVAILDGIEDPHNIGAIVRSADAAGVKAVILPQRRSAGLTRTVARVSAGALASMRMVRITNLVSTLEKLKDRGFWIAGLALEGAQGIYESDLKRPIALVIGGEGDGISRLVSEHCDFLVKIPMHGSVQSLNASVAAGVIFYEVVRQNLASKVDVKPAIEATSAISAPTE